MNLKYFHEIHADFDEQVKRCLIMALLSPAAIIACEAWNVYNTSLAIAEATDAYNECMSAGNAN